jgi:glycosidase
MKNNYLHKTFCTYFSLMLLLITLGCSKQSLEPGSSEPPTEPEEYDYIYEPDNYVQYGDPFDKVPQTSDIVMYEVNIEAFSQKGNLKGIEERLDELKSLGVNVVWLMPIHPIGKLKGFGSPYAVRNYTEIKPAYGNLEDLRNLVKEAHKREMAVIMDWVANHTAWDHHWMKYPDWYTKDANGNIQSPPGMGWNDVANLNFGHEDMRKEMIKAMRYWILEANIDGFRCDYAEGVPNGFWRQAIDSLRNIPDRKIIMFAEAARQNLLSTGFDMIFGWTFYHRLREVVNQNQSANILASTNISDYQNVAEGKHIVRWIDNHDENAWDDTPLKIFKGIRGKMAAFVITAYMGGVPLIYNGQEVGFPERLPFFENGNVKIDWSLNPDILEEYKKILAIRANHPAVRWGTMESSGAHDNVVAFKRMLGEEEILVIVNVRENEVSYEVPGSIKASPWQNLMNNSLIEFDQTITLEGFSYLILKK